MPNQPIQHKLLQAVFRAPSASLSIHDENMTETLSQTYRFTAGQAAAVKKLFTEQLLEVRKAVSKARAFHRDHTFQGIGPTRIIVTGEQEIYETGMTKHLEAIRAACNRFIESYPAHIARERELKQDSFREDDYPPVGKLSELFRTEFLIMPMPEPGDFIKSVAGDAAERLKHDYQAALAAVEQDVRQQVLGKMLKLIAETAESLASDGPIVDNENKKGPLAKLREYLERVPQLNITNDPEINKLVSECNDKLNVSTEALRQSEFYRKKTAQDALNIAQSFGSVGNRKLAA